MVSSWVTYLSSFFTFPICFKCCKTVNVEFLASFSCSAKRVSFDDPSHWVIVTSNGQPLCYSSWRLSFPLQKFLNHHCTVCLLAVPGPNVLMMLRVVSATLQPILNSNKKITRICFLFNITSIVKNKYKQQVIIH